MIYEYKGTEYEFPDDWSDEQALTMILRDRGEAVEQQQPVQQQSRPEPIWSRKTGAPQMEKIVPYYKAGYESLKKQPYETLFPGASSVKGRGIGAGIKRNVIGAIDLLGIPDRAVDYASGGALTRGKETLGQYIEKIPGESGLARFGKDVLHAGKEIATSPTSYVGLGTVKSAVTKETPETIIRQLGKKTELDKAINIGIDKGIKPKVKNKSNYRAMSQFNKKAQTAVRTIAENRNMLSLKDEVGETIARPRNAVEMAQAIEQTKSNIYRQYHQMATRAGDAGAQFDVNPILRKLDDISKDSNISTPPDIRKYAKKVRGEIEELQGASPEVVESRIKDLNNSLMSFYDGRVSKAKAEVDASVANLMRKELDDNITRAIGEGYQELKNKYGALKAIEKEVNHRAIVNARRNSKSLVDFTDIFTGGDLISGLLTANPALVARGVVGRGIKESIKAINNPDRYINNMFKKVYSEYPKTSYLWSSATPEKPITIGISKSIKERPAYLRRGLDPEGDFLRKEAERRATQTAIREMRPKVTEQQATIEAVRQFQKGVKPKFPNIKNQRGSIGSMAEEFIGTPAIRDPKTGKIYKGGWRGHKDAIIKGENESVQSRLRYEHFKDNSNKPTSNVGFIDKNGNFISRAEAEKMMEKKTSGSLAQQFHNIGIMTGLGAGAGTGLTIGSILSEKKKRR